MWNTVNSVLTLSVVTPHNDSRRDHRTGPHPPSQPHVLTTARQDSHPSAAPSQPRMGAPPSAQSQPQDARILLIWSNRMAPPSSTFFGLAWLSSFSFILTTSPSTARDSRRCERGVAW